MQTHIIFPKYVGTAWVSRLMLDYIEKSHYIILADKRLIKIRCCENMKIINKQSPVLKIVHSQSIIALVVQHHYTAKTSFNWWTDKNWLGIWTHHFQLYLYKIRTRANGWYALISTMSANNWKLKFGNGEEQPRVKNSTQKKKEKKDWASIIY